MECPSCAIAKPEEVLLSLSVTVGSPRQLLDFTDLPFSPQMREEDIVM